MSVGEHAAAAREAVEAVYRGESRRVLATLIRLLGGFDLAEDALHDAFAAALERWPKEGVPANPRAWLISTGRFKAIDAMRRSRRVVESQDKIADELNSQPPDIDAYSEESLKDDQLRLIFTCCH